jgi:hypothetical protein
VEASHLAHDPRVGAAGHGHAGHRAVNLKTSANARVIARAPAPPVHKRAVDIEQDNRHGPK